MRSGRYDIYKSIGAAQFSYAPPRFNDKGFVEKEGSIILNVAPGNKDKNNPIYDWSDEKKIVFSIGIADIAIMLDETKEKIKLTHQYNESTKTLEFTPATDPKYQGTYMLNVSEISNNVRKNVQVPFSNGEFNLLLRLITSVASSCIYWTNDKL